MAPLGHASSQVPKLVIDNILTFVFHRFMGPTVILTEIYRKAYLVVVLEIRQKR